MRILFTSGLLFFSVKLFACLNIYGVDMNGDVHLQHHYFQLYKFDDKIVKNKIAELEGRFSKKTYDFRDVSDYAAYLLMAGNHEEGLSIFRRLHEKYPDEYALKANLAVAFELNGKMDSALLWQKEAIAQNPDAHSGSEWIHIEILEARIAQQNDSTWLKDHEVTSIKTKVKVDYFDTDILLEQFLTQVNERLPFSFKQDKVFGKVFFEFGKVYENTSIYRAYYCYALASYFNEDLKRKTNERMTAIRQVYSNKPAKIKRDPLLREKYAPGESEIASYLAKLDQRKKVMNNLSLVNVNELFSNLVQ